MLYAHVIIYSIKPINLWAHSSCAETGKNDDKSTIALTFHVIRMEYY